MLSPVMRYRFAALSLGIGLIAARSAPRIKTQHAVRASELTAAQAQADFDMLRGALEETHGALYRFSSKPTLDRRFDDYRARLNRPITQLAFIAVISEMLAEVRDGHLRLEYDDSTAASLTRVPLFPLRVLKEGPRLTVLSNDTPSDSTIRPGTEILGINGHSARDIIALLLPKLPGDGFIQTGKDTRLGRNFAQYYWLFVDQSATFTVTARNADGTTVTATLPGVTNADRGKNDNAVNARMRAGMSLVDGPADNVSLRFLRDSAVAHLRIRAFDGQDYPASVEAAFRTVREQGTRAMILDLRGNGGGVDEYGALLVSYFTDKPFRYFDRIHLATIKPSFATWRPRTFDDLRDGIVPDPGGGYLVTPKLHVGVTEHSPASTPFLGTLFVLMDGGTFSTSADVTAILHNLRRATFVGEETAGTYEGNTSGLNALITLPNSGLRLKINMYGYFNAVSQPANGRGTLPDVVAEKHASDLLRGFDAPLAQALSRIR